MNTVCRHDLQVSLWVQSSGEVYKYKSEQVRLAKEEVKQWRIRIKNKNGIKIYLRQRRK